LDFEKEQWNIYEYWIKEWIGFDIRNIIVLLEGSMSECFILVNHIECQISKRS